jgi:predicted nucleic acid-binding protein
MSTLCESPGSTGLAWYDSIIVASALEGKCKTLYSEDFQHGRQIEGLRIENPFA